MSRVEPKQLALVIGVAALLGALIGLVAGLAANRFGINAGLIAPLGGAVGGGFAATVYRLRTGKRRTT